jgi:hypothetical protein
MRAGVLVTGILGLGTALVFAAAALTATMFPNGTIVNAGWNGGPLVRGGWGGGVAVPMPAPGMIEGFDGDSVIVDDGLFRADGGIVVEEGFVPLPGDVVDEDPAAP